MCLSFISRKGTHCNVTFKRQHLKVLVLRCVLSDTFWSQEWVCHILRDIAYTFISIYYLSLVLTHHPAVIFHIIMGGMAGLRHPWNSTMTSALLCEGQHWLIQWAHLQLNPSGKYITGSCFPSRIWGYFELVRGCWSENYNRGKRFGFLHQLWSGAWKTCVEQQKVLGDPSENNL